MNERESKLLLVGDNVTIQDPITHVGTVMETTSNGVRMEWDDGQEGWIDHRDMATISFHGDKNEMRQRSLRRTKQASNYIQAVRSKLTGK